MAKRRVQGPRVDARGAGGARRCEQCRGVLFDGEQPREGRFVCDADCWEDLLEDAGEHPREPAWRYRYEVLAPEPWNPGTGTKYRPVMTAVYATNDRGRAEVDARCRAYGTSRPVLVEVWDRAVPQPAGTYKGRRAQERGTLLWDEVR